VLKQTNESMRFFILRVQPAQFDLTWYATLEDEHQPQLKFHSPLELARFLADLNTNEPNEKDAHQLANRFAMTLEHDFGDTT
jgi:hypothetical protein